MGCTGLPIADDPIDLEKELGRKTADEEGEDRVVKYRSAHIDGVTGAGGPLRTLSAG